MNFGIIFWANYSIKTMHRLVSLLVEWPPLGCPILTSGPSTSKFDQVGLVDPSQGVTYNCNASGEAVTEFKLL